MRNATLAGTSVKNVQVANKDMKSSTSLLLGICTLKP